MSSTQTDWFRGSGIAPADALVPDRHQAALHRLAGVTQYLYDTMGGDYRSSEPTARSPLPLLATEKVRKAQRLLDEAIKDGQRTRRQCLGGEVGLVEDWKAEHLLATPSTQEVRRVAERYEVRKSGPGYDWLPAWCVVDTVKQVRAAAYNSEDTARTHAAELNAEPEEGTG